MMFKDLVKIFVSPLLKQHGFRKNRLTWNKTVDGLIQVVDFQVSRFSSPEEESFTINLGVFYPDIWHKCWAKEPPKFVNEEDCFPRVRIAQILNGYSQEATDYWWTCNAEVEIDKIGKEIKMLLEKKCLPFLDEMLDLQNVIRLYSSGPVKLTPIEKIYLAIMKYSIGDIDSSIDLLKEVSTISNAWASRVDAIRSRLA